MLFSQEHKTAGGAQAMVSRMLNRCAQARIAIVFHNFRATYRLDVFAESPWCALP